MSLSYGKPEFTSKKPGTEIPVIMTEPFALEGKDADLYKLVQPHLKGTILAKGSGNGNASGGSSGDDSMPGALQTGDASDTSGVWIILLALSSIAGIISLKKRS